MVSLGNVNMLGHEKEGGKTECQSVDRSTWSLWGAVSPELLDSNKDGDRKCQKELICFSSP